MNTTGVDPDKLLVKIHSGKKLSELELTEILHVVSHFRLNKDDVGTSLDEIYSYLVVLGEAHAYTHRQVLERYLELHDPLTVSLVLEILCLKWNLTEEYLERVIQFTLGAPWDDEYDVQQMAIKVLGEFLFEARKNTKTRELNTKELRVLELLLSIFEDEQIDSWVRQRAYQSLCRTSGKSWEEIPSEYMQIDFKTAPPPLDEKLRAAVSIKIKRSANS